MVITNTSLKQWILCFIFSLVYSSVTCVDYSVQCSSPKQFEVGQHSEVTGTVDSTNFGSCAGGTMGVTTVSFRIADDSSGTNPITLCTLTYPTCGHSVTQGQTTCSCVSSSGTTHSYSMSLFYEEAFTGRYLGITSNCIEPPTQPLTRERCGPMEDPCADQTCNGFGTCDRPQGTCTCNECYDSGTNCTKKPCCPASFCDCSSECSSEPCCYGCIIMIILIIVIVVVIIVLLVNCFCCFWLPILIPQWCKERKRKTSVSTAGNPPEPENKGETFTMNKMVSGSQDFRTEPQSSPKPSKLESVPGHKLDQQAGNIFGDKIPPIPSTK